ncbi:tetratricopeptide repeat protein [Ferruginibacter albus]|uniref:tetratricopeptide repeat protein n=1 Tax=Ferruginibacter albus TaxID=2875540 RepID=UPI001CC460BA|nr:hypothetical protein [Ferruginibacter albus]UAY53172.1 hypothetical protein K9M53_05745 [Ferruginibacter albus]
MERIEKLKEFLKSNPDDSFLKHALALEYIKISEDATARTLFEDILQTEPGYVGSYYHLGKLLERINDRTTAITIYEKGMKEAKQAGDNHAYSELQTAYDDLMD